MTYELTQHARDAMEEREIAMEWVERVLKNPSLVEPDKTDSGLQHRLKAIPEFGNRVLRVVVDPRIAPVRIITVYFDRKMKGKL